MAHSILTVSHLDPKALTRNAGLILPHCPIHLGNEQLNPQGTFVYLFFLQTVIP